MKTKTAIMVCLCILYSACKKNTTNPTNPAIKGTWELRATRNGNIMPATYPPGNGHLLSFGNTTFTEYEAGAITVHGNYTKSVDTTFQYTLSFIPTDSYFRDRTMFKKDTLVVFPGQPDISTAFYIKASADTAVLYLTDVF